MRSHSHLPSYEKLLSILLLHSTLSARYKRNERRFFVKTLTKSLDEKLRIRESESIAHFKISKKNRKNGYKISTLKSIFLKF